MQWELAGQGTGGGHPVTLGRGRNGNFPDGSSDVPHSGPTTPLSGVKTALPLPFSPSSLLSSFPGCSQMKAPSQMIHMLSHIHPLPTGDSSLSQAMLVPAAKISSRLSIRMLWVIPISLRRFLPLGSAPDTRKILGPWNQACPLPCSMGGHSLGHHSVPRPGSATALLRDRRERVLGPLRVSGGSFVVG